MLAVIVIVCLVMLGVCAVVTVIYAYLYFTRMSPAAQAHRESTGGSGSAVHGGAVDRQTKMMPRM